MWSLWFEFDEMSMFSSYFFKKIKIKNYGMFIVLYYKVGFLIFLLDIATVVALTLRAITVFNYCF